ncbi:uncharacterized protein TM35_000211660 [Trypanosoma theileri]|uniref:RING-type domain-containing protein n=1 Tax=Trypanosoma theileri TaxID=67003 RepID=A0A1X0NTX8_9TRYP|nr:uncharacterized protein TM35_000211660 [Trypanosoma theileri]ORC87560.1 hypothetical protein TM35_000211660 [Trypanosoma theileri]
MLFDTLRVAECSICLQTLLPGSSGSCGSPSPRNTPQKNKPISSQGSTHSRRDVEGTEREREREREEEEEEFRITFAPGVPRLNDGNELGIDSITRTFLSAVEEYRKKEKRSHGLSPGDLDESHVNMGNEGIVVLPCGHMLHFPCAVQLYEYKNDAKCPICRQPLKGVSDFLLFSPSQRPSLSHNNNNNNNNNNDNYDNNNNNNNNNNGSGDSGDDVQFTGERRVAAVDAYSYRLHRETLELKRRRRNLRGREGELTSSKEQLEEQCRVLQKSAGESRRRYEVLTNQGSVGIERLAQLQSVARETHTSLNLLTKELAKLTRELVMLDRQVEKYRQRLQRCRAVQRGEVVNEEETGTVHGDVSSLGLRKRRLKSPESGRMLSYYI